MFPTSTGRSSLLCNCPSTTVNYIKNILKLAWRYLFSMNQDSLSSILSISLTNHLSVFIISLRPHVRLPASHSQGSACSFLWKQSVPQHFSSPLQLFSFSQNYQNPNTWSTTALWPALPQLTDICYPGLRLKNTKFNSNYCSVSSLITVKTESALSYIPRCEHAICLFPKHRTKIFIELFCLCIDYPKSSVQSY